MVPSPWQQLTRQVSTKFNETQQSVTKLNKFNSTNFLISNKKTHLDNRHCNNLVRFRTLDNNIQQFPFFVKPITTCVSGETGYEFVGFGFVCWIVLKISILDEGIGGSDVKSWKKWEEDEISWLKFICIPPLFFLSILRMSIIFKLYVNFWCRTHDVTKYIRIRVWTVDANDNRREFNLDCGEKANRTSLKHIKTSSSPSRLVNSRYFRKCTKTSTRDLNELTFEKNSFPNPVSKFPCQPSLPTHLFFS